MGLRIATNITSLVAQRNLEQVKRKQDKTFQKLSSGSRIVSSGDDAAGLAISERLRGIIRSTTQATRNANDGIALIQTAEGGLSELSDILIRLRELSVQSASDTIGDVGRSFSDKEFQELVEEIDRIAQSTEFNGRTLLNGEGERADIHIGVNSNPELSILSYDVSQSDARTTTLGIDGLGVLGKKEALESLDVIDGAIDAINGNRAGLGALQSRLQSTVNNLMVSKENVSSANSKIRDTDVAAETTELARSNILTNASIAVLSQANMASGGALKLIG